VTRRFLSVPIVVAALALVAASCGGQPFPQTASTPTTVRPASADPGATRDPRAWLLASVQRTSALRSARLALSEKIAGTGDQTLTLTGTGGIDFVGRKSSLTMHGDAGGDPIDVEVRVVGGTAYTRSSGVDWVSTPVSSADVNTPNAASYLTYLQGISSQVTVAGHEVLRGVDTTRYEASVDLDRALAHATTPTQRKFYALALTVFGGSAIPATAWIDGDGHLRKVQMSFDLSQLFRNSGEAPSGAPKLVVSLELYDFGAPIRVVAPSGALDAATAARTRAAQSDLRNALTTEKTIFVDSQMYTADPAALKQVESSLDWGGKLKVVVGDAEGMHDAVVCLSEPSAGGPVFSIADVSVGPNAGTYYGRSACPNTVDEVSMSRLAKQW
jgi:hypothetical protein